ncbi:hypothetical protein EMPS_03063 [Entomortierella parvispora]|uniref:Uncharacterized protein n=1 Tax=Entomortierella parvispora TaxID=205924 RepID=A0A9P3H636_9FUNG|nr:hypothetical protein EMPS_03063 [Entomortierella parvispora]
MTFHSLSSPLLPLQQPPKSTQSSSRPLSYKRAALALVAISSALLVINTVHVQLTSPSLNSSSSPSTDGHVPTPHPLHNYEYKDHPEKTNGAPESHSPYAEPEYDEGFPEEDFTNDTSNTEEDGDDEDTVWDSTESEGEEESEEDGSQGPSWIHDTTPKPHVRPSPVRPGSKEFKAQDVIPAHCPAAFLSTESSFDPPSYASSSSTPVASSTFASSASEQALRPDQVYCRPILSHLQDYTLALCISYDDCSQGFIQIIHRNISTLEPFLRFKVSKNSIHDQYFRQVAGPDDFYFLIEGAQKLALSAQLVPKDLMVTLPDTPSTTTAEASLLVYRANFRMTLPGPVKISGWLTYERFRATMENRPGTWPQWTHELLVDPSSNTEAAPFTVCPKCDLSLFLDRLRSIRESEFESCDRMAPTRGSYWQEHLALRVFSNLDIINQAPGAGVNLDHAIEYDYGNPTQVNKGSHVVSSDGQEPKLTRGWRFVPSGCTMTPTGHLPNAPSQDPYSTTCDSMTSPPSEMRGQSASSAQAPRRRILFAGDSQVRTTYNAILNHYRPVDPQHQKFNKHDEFLPGLDSLDWSHKITSQEPTSATKIPRSKADTEIELVYRADQFLDDLIASSDEDLDQYDTIFLNLGQWPASGPVAGGQWNTAQLTDRWEEVVARLNRWKESRKERALRISDLNSLSKVRIGKSRMTGDGSSVVVWAGMNAFPMRTDSSIKVKGDWRTNARLGYWDDWIETISQREGGWFRRLNAWQLTFPMLDQIVDKAHFQETDAIDALKIEALYKLDLCSRVVSDPIYSSPSLTESRRSTSERGPSSPTSTVPIPM